MKAAHGENAVAALEQNVGRPLSDLERHIALLEGYSKGQYTDHKGNVTTGAGKTGKWANVPFDQVVQEFEGKTRQMVPEYDKFPDYLKKELVQAAYRGDLGGSPKFREQLNAGNYGIAAKEFLDNSEYKNSGTPESIKKRMEAVSNALYSYNAQGDGPDLLASIRDRDEQRRLGAQMGDMEFQMDIAPHFDYKGPIDPSIARYRGVKGLSGDVDLTLGGFYAHPDNPNDPYTQEELKPFSGAADGIQFEVPKEPGTINAVHSKATSNIWAHEYGHQLRGSGEEYQRLADAATAQNERDWESAVQMWRDWKLRKGVKLTPSEAQEDLISRLEYNVNLVPRRTYREDYARGARGSVATRSPTYLMRDDSAYVEERIDKSLWKRKAEELKALESWKEGLPERNKERAVSKSDSVSIPQNYSDGNWKLI